MVQLRNILRHAWRAIPQPYIRNLFNSMRRSVGTCARGGQHRLLNWTTLDFSVLLCGHYDSLPCLLWHICDQWYSIFVIVIVNALGCFVYIKYSKNGTQSCVSFMHSMNSRHVVTFYFDSPTRDCHVSLGYWHLSIVLL